MVLDRDPFREKLVRLDLPLFINVMIPDCWGGRPHGIECQNWGCKQPRPEPSMTQYKRIAIDTSKSVFTDPLYRRSGSAGPADQSSPRATAAVLQEARRHRGRH